MPRAATSVATSTWARPVEKRAEGPFPLGLRPVAVDGLGRHVEATELLGQPVGTVLGAGEHDRRPVAPDHVGGDGDALVALGPPEHVTVDGGVDVELDAVAGGVALVAADQGVDVAVEGGGEEQRLALRHDLVEQPLHLGQEAHVGHAVGLVEHDDVDPVEADGTPLDEVGQAARAGHDHVDAGPQGCELGSEADAAVEGVDGAPHGGEEVLELVADLGGQLTGRDEHQRLGPLGRRVGDAGGERQAEGQRLAGAGGGPPAHVAPGEGVGQRGHLDGERAR